MIKFPTSLDVDIDAMKGYILALQPVISILALLSLLAIGIYISLKNTHDDRNNPLKTRALQIGGYVVITVSCFLLIVGLYLVAKKQ